jgi:hypothetical protein
MWRCIRCICLNRGTIQDCTRRRSTETRLFGGEGGIRTPDTFHNFDALQEHRVKIVSSAAHQLTGPSLGPLLLKLHSAYIWRTFGWVSSHN